MRTVKALVVLLASICLLIAAGCGSSEEAAGDGAAVTGPPPLNTETELMSPEAQKLFDELREQEAETEEEPLEPSETISDPETIFDQPETLDDPPAAGVPPNLSVGKIRVESRLEPTALSGLNRSPQSLATRSPARRLRNELTANPMQPKGNTRGTRAAERSTGPRGTYPRCRLTRMAGPSVVNPLRKSFPAVVRPSPQTPLRGPLLAQTPRKPQTQPTVRRRR